VRVSEGLGHLTCKVEDEWKLDLALAALHAREELRELRVLLEHEGEGLPFGDRPPEVDGDSRPIPALRLHDEGRGFV